MDYTKIASLELPEGFDENAGGEEEEEPVARNELMYLAGRLYRDTALEERRGGVRWVYEKYAKVTTSEAMPNMQQTLVNLYKKASGEQNEFDERVREANKAKLEAAEEKLR